MQKSKKKAWVGRAVRKYKMVKSSPKDRQPRGSKVAWLGEGGQFRGGKAVNSLENQRAQTATKEKKKKKKTAGGHRQTCGKRGARKPGR